MERLGMDWQQKRPINGTERDIAMKIAIDVGMPMQNYETLCFQAFSSTPKEMLQSSYVDFSETILRTYFNDPTIDTLKHCGRLSQRSKSQVDGAENLIDMVQKYLFGKSRVDSKRPTGKSRNQPCPCGSGRKFKKCCGRN